MSPLTLWYVVLRQQAIFFCVLGRKRPDKDVVVVDVPKIIFLCVLGRKRPDQDVVVIDVPKINRYAQLSN